MKFSFTRLSSALLPIAAVLEAHVSTIGWHARVFFLDVRFIQQNNFNMPR